MKSFFSVSIRFKFLLVVTIIGLSSPQSQAVDSFSMDWFTVDGGHAAMTGGTFTLSATAGQADAGLPTLASGEQFLKGGFWAQDFTALGGVVPSLRIQLSGTSELWLSWYPDTPGFSLQESGSLLPDSWGAILPFTSNPTTLPVPSSPHFYRLIRP